MARLKRYVEEQRLHMDDEISKDGETWYSAGSSSTLFPVYVEMENPTLTLSVEPEFGAEFDPSDTASTILEEIDFTFQPEDDEDTAYLDIKPGFFSRDCIPYVVLSTYFVFGVSFGFGLFMAIQTLMNY